MKFNGWTSALLGVLPALTSAYVLDASCSAYTDLIAEGMKGATDMAQAAEDLFVALSSAGSGPVRQAQEDLVSYLFTEAMTDGKIDPNNENHITAFNTISNVLNYYQTKDGKPQTTPANYRDLKTTDLIIYCDYSRFKENQNCNGETKKGYTCDTSIGVSFLIGDIYSNCKSTSAFKMSETQVRPSITTRYMVILT